MNAKYFQPNTLWWVDFSIILNMPIFFFQKFTNNFYLQLTNRAHYFYYLITLNHINSFLFYILDATAANLSKNNLIIAHQSVFFDYKIISITPIKNSIQSISKLNKGSTWLEREDRELNDTNYNNLADSRKLLLNYNYNEDVFYQNFNHIVNDVYL